MPEIEGDFKGQDCIGHITLETSEPAVAVVAIEHDGTCVQLRFTREQCEDVALEMLRASRALRTDV